MAAPALWQNRNWRWLWLGQSVSLIGDMVFTVTVVLWIATRLARTSSGVIAPWAPAAVSGALIAAAVPALLVGPFAGVWVDRWDRRATMLTADAMRCVLIAGLLVLPLAGHQMPASAQLVALYAVVAAAGCCAQFFNPARLAVTGSVVAETQQPKASGQLQAMSSLAQVIGPPIAAALIISGVQWALIIDAASFAVSFWYVRAIQMPAGASDPRPQRASFTSEFRAGLGYFARSPVLRGLAAGVMITMLGAGALNAVVVFFIQHNLHVSAAWLGTTSGTIGAGAIAGALAVGVTAGRAGLGRLLWLSLIAGGLALIGLSRCTALPPALGACLLLGVAVGIINAVAGPLMLRTTPMKLMGRVSAIFSPLLQIASIASMALAGALASTVLARFHTVIGGVTFGPYDTVITISGLMFAAAGLALISPMRHTLATHATSQGTSTRNGNARQAPPSADVASAR
ncbi:MAG TPA: MFS transporter [Streptosporangiaceae bacterium]